MDVKYERCCGIDGHKRSLVACVIVLGEAGLVVKITRSFGTMREDLLELLAWLSAQGVTPKGVNW